MAYAFNKLDEYLRGNRGQQLPGSANMPKTSAGAPAGVATGKQTQPASAASAASTGRAILERAKGEGTEAVANRILQPAVTQAGNIKASIGEGAKNYIAGEESKINTQFGTPSNVSEIVSGAATGNQENIGKLTGMINPTAYSPSTAPQQSVEGLAPVEYSRSGNVGNYLQKQSGGRYTPGMGLIDQMNYQKSGAGGLTSKVLGAIQGDVQTYADAADAAMPDLQKTARAKQEETAKAVREAIAAKQQSINDAVQAALAAQQAKYDTDSQEARSKAIGGLENIVTNESAVSEVLPSDWSSYITPTETPEEFTTPEISQYNTLASIIGGQGMVNPTVTRRTYAPNESAFREWLASQSPYSKNPSTPVNFPEGETSQIPSPDMPAGLPGSGQIAVNPEADYGSGADQAPIQSPPMQAELPWNGVPDATPQTAGQVSVLPPEYVAAAKVEQPRTGGLIISPESEGFTPIPENELVPYNPTISAPPMNTSIPDYVPPPDPTYKTAGQVSVMPSAYVNPEPTTPKPTAPFRFDPISIK